MDDNGGAGVWAIELQRITKHFRSPTGDAYTAVRDLRRRVDAAPSLYAHRAAGGQAATAYNTPRPYRCRLTLFLSSSTLPSVSRPADPRLRWRRKAAQGLDMHWFPGDHYTIVAKPVIVRLRAATQAGP